MSFSDNDNRQYNAAARFFHWVVAFLVIGMLAFGLTMGDVNYGMPVHEAVDLHKSIGIVILLLAIARLLWRFASVPPEALDTHAVWEKMLARAAHFYLYFALFAMPLSGWLMSSAGGRPPHLFGLPVPRLIGYDESLLAFFRQAHEVIAYGLIIVIGLHVAGALKHHIIDKDATLRRMAGDRLQWLKVVFAVLLLDLLLSAGAVFFLKDAVVAAIPNAQGVARDAGAAAAPDIRAVREHSWAIDPRASTLTFSSRVMGVDFTGHFNKFDGSIVFDPDDLSTAQADIAIDMRDIVTGDKSRDEMLVMPDWFAADDYPRAHFVTDRIEQLEGHNYVAIGELTIRDATMPLTLPFSLEFQPAGEVSRVRMTAQVDISRLDFGVGQGEWQATEAVPDEVRVQIDLTALQPRR